MTEVTPPHERVLGRVTENDEGCWLWPGARSRNYGAVSKGGHSDGATYTHRVMYEAFVGPIPDGLHLDHLCEVTLCCNPGHLEPVTAAENNRRYRESGRVQLADFCVHGHPFSGDNLYVTPSGRRHCRECLRANSRRYAERRKRANDESS